MDRRGVNGDGGVISGDEYSEFGSEMSIAIRFKFRCSGLSDTDLHEAILSLLHNEIRINRLAHLTHHRNSWGNKRVIEDNIWIARKVRWIGAVEMESRLRKNN